MQCDCCMGVFVVGCILWRIASANASHELKTQFTAISGYAELLFFYMAECLAAQ